MGTLLEASEWETQTWEPFDLNQFAPSPRIPTSSPTPPTALSITPSTGSQRKSGRGARARRATGTSRAPAAKGLQRRGPMAHKAWFLGGFHLEMLLDSGVGWGVGFKF